jgi:hypothetical protein
MVATDLLQVYYPKFKQPEGFEAFLMEFKRFYVVLSLFNLKAPNPQVGSEIIPKNLHST